MNVYITNFPIVCHSLSLWLLCDLSFALWHACSGFGQQCDTELHEHSYSYVWQAITDFKRILFDLYYHKLCILYVPFYLVLLVEYVYQLLATGTHTILTCISNEFLVPAYLMLHTKSLYAEYNLLDNQ